MSNCDRCESLAKEYSIESAFELQAIVRMISAELVAGTIVEDAYWPEGQVRFAQPPFLQFPIVGPWPDYCEYYFRCTMCDCLFRLSVETYHGMGGEWGIYWQGGHDGVGTDAVGGSGTSPYSTDQPST